ncbi:MAG: prepilin-type N-terminal cleavage/methylation protein [Rhodospirillales bacterium]|nr:prepilin-type N-terminal cleavage/methylation protein [Rhodospirillales bacterium]
MRGSRPLGFTLLEVLVALAILGAALGALLQAFTGGFHRLSVLEDYSTAVTHARSELDRLGAELPLAEGQYSGSFTDGMTWTAQLRRYDVGSSGKNAALAVITFEITVTVFWREHRALTLSSLRLASQA